LRAILLVGFVVLSMFAVDANAIAADGLRVGDWWRVSYEDLQGGGVSEFVYAVSETDGQTAAFGVASSSLDATPFALPMFPVGNVDVATLTFLAAGSSFQPTPADAHAGATWTTEWAGIPIIATIEQADASGTRVEFAHHDGTRHGRIRLDAEGMFREHTIDGVAAARVVAHGRGADCRLYVPTETRMLPFVDYGASAPHARNTHVTFDEAYENLAMLLVAHAPQSGDVARLTITGTGGEVIDVAADPTTGTSHQVRSWFSSMPDGLWHATEAVSGNGHVSVFSVGVNYLTRDGGEGAACLGPESDGASPVLLAGSAAVPVSTSGLAGLFAAGIAAVGLIVLLVRRGTFVALFVKLHPDQVESQRVRSTLMQIVRTQPGLTTQELRREAGIAWGSVVYHLQVLERNRKVVATSWGRHRHWFDPQGHASTERAWLAASAHAPARKILGVVGRCPGVRQKELAAEVHLHRATVGFHILKLEALGIVERRDDAGDVRYFLAHPFLAADARS
jgi:predicted transcriptional regulator